MPHQGQEEKGMNLCVQAEALLRLAYSLQLNFWVTLQILMKEVRQMYVEIPSNLCESEILTICKLQTLKAVS